MVNFFLLSFYREHLNITGVLLSNWNFLERSIKSGWISISKSFKIFFFSFFLMFNASKDKTLFLNVNGFENIWTKDFIFILLQMRIFYFISWYLKVNCIFCTILWNMLNFLHHFLKNWLRIKLAEAFVNDYHNSCLNSLDESLLLLVIFYFLFLLLLYFVETDAVILILAICSSLFNQFHAILFDCIY